MEHPEHVHSVRRIYKHNVSGLNLFQRVIALIVLVIGVASGLAVAQTGVAYVANTDDNTVTVTNGFDAVAGPAFQLTIPVGSKPVGVTVNSKFAYVTNSADNTVSVIDTGTNTVVQTLPVGKKPTGAASSETFVYIANSDDGTVSIIDVANGNKVLPTALKVGKTPVAVAIAPAPNGSVLVANSGDNTVSVISNNVVIGSPIPVGTKPSGIAIDTQKNTGTFLTKGVLADGEFAYVTNAGDNTVSVLILPSTPGGTITVQPQAFAVGLGPTGISVFAPFLFIANTASTDPPTVSVFDSASTTNSGAPTQETFSPLSLGTETLPTEIAFTNDGYATFVTTPGTNNAAVITNGYVVNNPIPTGTNPNGVAVTPNDPAVCAFNAITVNENSVYQCPSGNSSLCNPLPTLVVPAGASVLATVQCSSSASQGASFDTMSLSFGQGTNCTLSGGSPGTGPCQAQNTTGIGGQTTFPSSGVFTIQATGTSTTSTGSAALRALVGANCTLAIPNLVQLNATVTASLSCTAPAGDQLSATLDWGDGATSTATGTGAGSTPLQLSLVPPTHAYAKTGSVVVMVTNATDTTEKSPAAFTPASIKVTISETVPTSCTLSVTPTTVQVSAAVAASLNCSAGKGDVLSATINWGDDTTSPSSGTADATGRATLSFAPHSFANPGIASVTASVQDTTANLPGTVTPSAIQVTVNSPTTPPTVTPDKSSVPVAAGGSATVDLTFSAGPPHGGFTFACLGLPAGATCTFSPSSLTLDASGAGSVSVTVTTTGFSAKVVPHPFMRHLPFFYASLFVACVALASLERKGVKCGTRWSVGIVAAMLLLTILLAAAGCSNSTVSRTNTACAGCTPSGTYQITVVATSQKPVLQSKAVFTLTVGP